MTDSSSHEEAQLLARLTLLEIVVGMMVRDSMLSLERVRRTFLPLGKT